MAQPAVVTDPLLVLGFDPWGDQVTAMIARATAARGLAVSNDGALDTDGLARNAFARNAFARNAFARDAFARDAFARDALADNALAGEACADHVPPSQVAVLAMSWFGPDDPRQARVAAVRATLEAHGVAHLTVERHGPSMWVGPTVAPGHRGCDRCWRARRRQHAEFLPAEPAGSPDDQATQAAFDVESVRLGAKAAMAVGHRVLLESPEVEAGVVRRFAAGGGPSIGRVVAVSGCPRCDRSVPTLPGPTGAAWSLRPRATPDIATTDTGKEVKNEQLPRYPQ